MPKVFWIWFYCMENHRSLRKVSSKQEIIRTAILHIYCLTYTQKCWAFNQKSHKSEDPSILLMHIQFRVVAGCNIGQKLGYNPERSPVYLRVNTRKWAVVVHDALDVFVYLVLVLAVLNSIHTSDKKWFTLSNARWIQLQSTVLCKIPKFF